MSRLVVFVCLLAACSPEGGSPRRDGGSVRQDTGTVFDGGPGFDSGPFDSGPSPDLGGGECSAVSVMAESALAPVDIVWVIDDSGSMGNEAELIQNNMNMFASAINAAGLDVHVVLITGEGRTSASIPPPLGMDGERFLHLNRNVNSNEALSVLISEFPRYTSFLRRSSALHFVGVSDDESDIGWESFRSQLLGMLGKSFRFHAIVSPPGSTHSEIGFNMDGCTGPNGDAADNNPDCWSLALNTGGLALSICAPDWSRLFNDLTRAISVPQTLPCTYVIPSPPPGETFDRLQVNVDYTPGGGGGVQRIPYVESLDGCIGEGWYYTGGTEENPARVELCPSTCRRIEPDASGRVDVAFGCATELI